VFYKPTSWWAVIVLAQHQCTSLLDLCTCAVAEDQKQQEQQQQQQQRCWQDRLPLSAAAILEALPGNVLSLPVDQLHS
jgi:predicted ATPase